MALTLLSIKAVMRSISCPQSIQLPSWATFQQLLPSVKDYEGPITNCWELPLSKKPRSHSTQVTSRCLGQGETCAAILQVQRFSLQRIDLPVLRLWIQTCFGSVKLSCCREGTSALWYGYGSPLIGNSLFSFSIKILGGAKVVWSLVHICLLWATEKQTGFCIGTDLSGSTMNYTA